MSNETVDALKAQYDKLCKKRDDVNKHADPLLKKLVAMNEKIGVLGSEANALALQVSEMRGGQAWIDLKRQIGKLAAAIQALK